MADDPLAEFDPIFQAAGDAWNVDPLLLKSMARQESSGNPQAVSTAGALGLMQIMPDTARGLGMKDPLDPVESIWGAAKYMDEALRTEGTPESALLYYHGGPKWRAKYGDESKNYVPSVGRYYREYLAAAQQAAQPTVAARDKE